MSKTRSKKCLMGGGSTKLACFAAAVLCSINLSAANNSKQYELSQVNVDANVTRSGGLTIKTDKYQGVSTISRAMIESMPSGNGDFVQLLRTNPNVQFSNTNRQSTTMGEISPSNISINGSKFWQNNFMIDGVNINNDINPGRDRSNDNAYNELMIVGPSTSQGMAIDSDFLESIDVYDSDVSAKYGSFTGGVIDAKTRNPREGFHGKFSMSHTRDQWTKFHFYGKEQEEAFENSALASNQPHFKKYTTRLNLEGFLRDDLGLMFGYTNTRSKIPLKAYRDGFGVGESDTRVQRRNIDNYFLKALWYATDRLSITPSITYAPEEYKMFNYDAKDSFATMKSGGLNLAIKADYELDFMKINQTLAYNKVESSRDSEHEYYYIWRRSNLKPWGWPLVNQSYEGGYGDIEQDQKTLSYNLDTSFDEIDFWGLSHKFKSGLEVKKQKAKFHILRNFISASNAVPLGNAHCAAGDELCIEDGAFDGTWLAPLGSNGQFLSRKSVYSGSTNVDMLSYAFYLEDEMKLGNLTLRPGVRFSGDDYMDKKTVAPRFSSSYDIFGDDRSIVSFGANRYYGRNIFTYKLRDGMESLVTKYSRPSNPYSQNWIRNSTGVSGTKFTQLKIPYDDELSFGVKQKFGNFEVFGKYVNRKGKNQIVKTTRSNLNLPSLPGYATDYQTFTNDGWSKSDIYTFGVKTIDDFYILGTQNGFELNFEHIKSKTNNTIYDQKLDKLSLEDDKYIMLDGKVIKFSQIPVQDFARPWTASLNIITKIPSYGLNINNYFSYKGRQDAIVRTARANPPVRPYDIYEKVNLGNSYSWDARIGYAKKLPKEVELFVNLDIYNVLNRKNKARVLSETSSVLVYEAGRQFWLEAGIRW
ncbi:TonB-dependent receptor plug domain-containing protein [Campylobacter curvus]|uniref:TonB-dependent receptor plug domain-containing protein n=1 Tax=Campylobacter curvus TaxID=200 RepID=UPI00147039B6|nr:TonB-dependent receptor [Campylobacter curvus]